MEPVPQEDVEACLRVLTRVADDPADPALEAVRRAVDLAFRAGNFRVPQVFKPM